MIKIIVLALSTFLMIGNANATENALRPGLTVENFGKLFRKAVISRNSPITITRRNCGKGVKATCQFSTSNKIQLISVGNEVDKPATNIVFISVGSSFRNYISLELAAMISVTNPKLTPVEQWEIIAKTIVPAIKSESGEAKITKYGITYHVIMDKGRGIITFGTDRY